MFLESKPKNIFLNGSKCFPPVVKFPVARNFQAFTMGYAKAAENNVTDFKSFLETLDKTLEVVTILEDLDASLILLKRKFCWDFKDILYIHIHKRVGNNDRKRNDLLKIHKKWSTLDYILYDHFHNKFQDASNEMPDFQQEVNEFRNVAKIFNTFCNDMCHDFKGITRSEMQKIRNKLKKSIKIPEGRFHDGFSVTYQDCLILMAREQTNKILLKLRQYPAACANQTMARSVNLEEKDCEVQKHVYPGYHINVFEKVVLRTEVCLAVVAT